MTNTKTLKILFYLSLIVFLGSLATDTFFISSKNHFNNPPEIESYGLGWVILLMGWLDIFGIWVTGNSTFAWCANPLIFMSWYFVAKNKPTKGLVYGLLSLGFMLSFLLYTKVPINENGSVASIVSYGIGYWLWLTSAVLLCVYHFFASRLERAH